MRVHLNSSLEAKVGEAEVQRLRRWRMQEWGRRRGLKLPGVDYFLPSGGKEVLIKVL